jgi:hypothetical protein
VKQTEGSVKIQPETKKNTDWEKIRNTALKIYLEPLDICNPTIPYFTKQKGKPCANYRIPHILRGH